MIDRFTQLQQQKKRTSKPAKEEDGDIEKGQVLDPLLREFFDQVDKIRDGIQRIEINTSELEKLFKASLATVNSDEMALSSKKAELKITDTNRIAQTVRESLKKMDRECKELPVDHDAADYRMRSSHHAQLTKRFVAIMNAYQALQLQYKSKQTQQLQRQFLIAKPNASTEELAQLEGEEGLELLHTVFSVTSTAKAQEVLAELQERHRDIVNIESRLVELNQLFLDMSILVEQQGDLVDEIEQHVAQAAEYTQEAAQDLLQAVKYQKSALKKKWILILIVLVILIIIGAFFGATIASSSGSSSSISGGGTPPT